jgi:hypothetical protein
LALPSGIDVPNHTIFLPSQKLAPVTLLGSAAAFNPLTGFISELETVTPVLADPTQEQLNKIAEITAQI